MEAEKLTQAANNGGSGGVVRNSGVHSDRNAAHRRFMEDAHTILNSLYEQGPNNTAFFGVYDGHGGKTAALYCQANLAQKVREELAETLKPGTATGDQLVSAVEQGMTQAYLSTDNAMKETVPAAGSCVVTATLYCDHTASSTNQPHAYLTVANVGDSRAILNRGGKAEMLTEEHKASVESEKIRITQLGGFINADNRVNGYIAITRALGDHNMKELIIGKPYVRSVKLDPQSDRYIILACDGVWDVMSSQDAIDVLEEDRPNHNGDPTAMAKKLVITSLKKGSTDNLSVIIVNLF